MPMADKLRRRLFAAPVACLSLFGCHSATWLFPQLGCHSAAQRRNLLFRPRSGPVQALSGHVPAPFSPAPPPPHCATPLSRHRTLVNDHPVGPELIAQHAEAE